MIYSQFGMYGYHTSHLDTTWLD